MYRVTCPSCGRHLRMSRDIRQAKMKCRYCGGVFVGTTRPTADVAGQPAGPAQPPASDAFPRQPRHEDRTGESPGHVPIRPRSPILSVVIAIVGLGILVSGGWYVLQNWTRLSGKSARPGAMSQPAETSRPASRLAMPVATAPSEEPLPPESAPAASPEGESSQIAVLECGRLEGMENESATFIGRYRNNYPHGLKWVQIVVTVMNAKGAINQVSSEKYENIPAGWEGQFTASADYRFESGMRISNVSVYSRPAEKLTGWELKGWSHDVNEDDELKIKGVASNRTSGKLKDVSVCCDFFTKQGVYAGSARGVFPGGQTSLSPGQEAPFEILFDPKLAGYSASLLDMPVPRFVGTME
jgi:hypothetical protein